VIGNVELGNHRIKLDKPAVEINIVNSEIAKCKQDKLGRVYIWLLP